MSVIGHWRWRRRRNQDHGYWESADGERVGPIPLDESGRAAFVPADRLAGAVDLLTEVRDWHARASLRDAAPLVARINAYLTTTGGQ